MGIAFFWIVLSLVVGWGGAQKGRHFLFGFGWSLILSPLIGLVIILLARDLTHEISDATRQMSDAVAQRLRESGARLSNDEQDQLTEWLHRYAPPNKTANELAALYRSRLS